ncbi:MAG TPA: extensin family protein [Kofleriaceae bacterium]
MTRWLLVVLALSGVAQGTPKRGYHADNMPRGWHWPPNREMEAAAHACEAKLGELGVTWKTHEREGHIVDAITVPEGQLGGIQYIAEYRSNDPVMDCQLVLALASVAPALYDVGVREVHVGSTYRWSNIRVGGKTKNILSRHALGLAMDVVSFVDANGREAIVSTDYKKQDPLLLDVERVVNASGIFRTVLTPKNDPKSHHDHFHLEANPDYSRVDAKPSS